MASPSQDIIVACLDVGKPANIGWAIIDGGAVVTGDAHPQDDYSLDRFLEELVPRLDGRAVAIGFEAPLFIPVRRPRSTMTSKRQNEPKTWSFGAGLTCFAYAVPIMVAVFDRLVKETTIAPSLDWRAWDQKAGSLLVWEAFVSGKSKPTTPGHHNDALHAAQAFKASLPNLAEATSISVGNGEAFSTAAAALMYSGLADPSAQLLRSECLVISP